VTLVALDEATPMEDVAWRQSAAGFAHWSRPIDVAICCSLSARRTRVVAARRGGRCRRGWLPRCRQDRCWLQRELGEHGFTGETSLHAAERAPALPGPAEAERAGLVEHGLGGRGRPDPLRELDNALRQPALDTLTRNRDRPSRGWTGTFGAAVAHWANEAAKRTGVDLSDPVSPS
jgi:hypothetical protein